LHDEKRALCKEMRRCEGIISPIRRFPPEIVGEIFLYFTPALMNDHRFVDEYGNHRDQPCKIPWHLGQICSYW
ncbi:hypothetical protein B0H14DRAFT_2387808, partial [Mycena olivaceomarginata]